MKQFVFIASHLCSGSNELVSILNEHPQINILKTEISYDNKLSLINTMSLPHKLKNYSAIYGDQLLFNYQLSTKDLYNICSFIYIIRNAKDTIADIVRLHEYDEKQAYMYYSFRLRRLCEMATFTPGAVLLTWENLCSSKIEVINDYLKLKTPLLFDPSLFIKNESSLSYNLLQKAEECYERYFFYLRNLPLILPT